MSAILSINRHLNVVFFTDVVYVNTEIFPKVEF